MESQDKFLLAPTRTIMIIGFLNLEELHDYKEKTFKSDELADFYIVSKGLLLFVLFNDIRESIKFYNGFKSTELKISYTISKYELPKANEDCVERSFQSSISLYFYDVEDTDDNLVLNFLAKYGDIRELKNSQKNQKTIEFYSIKDARKAFTALNNSSFGTGEIKCRWTWDMSIQERTGYIRATDSFIKTHAKVKLDERIPVKKVKISYETKKNPILALFDGFIAEKIQEIENMVRGGQQY